MANPMLCKSFFDKVAEAAGAPAMVRRMIIDIAMDDVVKVYYDCLLPKEACDAVVEGVKDVKAVDMSSLDTDKWREFMPGMKLPGGHDKAGDGATDTGGSA